MINLKQLVSAIQESTLSASAIVAKQNLDILDTYFEASEGNSNFENLTESVLSSLSELDHEDSDNINKIKNALDSLSELISKAPPSHSADSQTLIPKYVDIAYPTETANGFESHTVSVPLICLAPLSSTQITELRFKTDLDISIVDDNLEVAFPERNSTCLEPSEQGGSPYHHATLEVVIDCKEPTQGLHKLVEGYDRALRAQIPG